MRQFAKSACAAVLLAWGVATAAPAAVIDFGNVSAPTGFGLGNAGLSGSFDDVYNFTIDPGLSLLFSASLSTGFSNRFFILDMEAELSDGAGPVASGLATTNVIPPGFPSRDITFDPIVLAAGDYALHVFGTATSSFPGPTSSYDGVLNLAAAPVPTPAGVVLLLTALAGFAVLRRADRGSRRGQV